MYNIAKSCQQEFLSNLFIIKSSFSWSGFTKSQAKWNWDRERSDALKIKQMSLKEIISLNRFTFS